MKKLFFVLCLFAPAYAGAEVVSSISFNPSRMGEYTYLKVADKATLRGGLNATTLNISSGGTVSVTPDNSTRIYDVPTVTGESGSSIDMPSTAFHGNTSNTYTGYKSEDSSVPSGLLPNVKAQGGDMKFTQDSYISTLYAVDRLRQKVGGLVGDSFEITGNGGSTISLYESADTKGFFLAGNDIPEPVAAHTNTSSNLTGCLLAWEKRKTSDSPAKEVWLLGLQGCNGAVEEASCTWEKGTSLLGCSLAYNRYCSLSGNWGAILAASTCGERGSVAEDLSGCPKATRGGICVVREQHSSVYACQSGGSWGSNLITACQGCVYTAKCSASKL